MVVFFLLLVVTLFGGMFGVRGVSAHEFVQLAVIGIIELVCELLILIIGVVAYKLLFVW